MHAAPARPHSLVARSAGIRGWPNRIAGRGRCRPAFGATRPTAKRSPGHRDRAIGRGGPRRAVPRALSPDRAGRPPRAASPPGHLRLRRRQPGRVLRRGGAGRGRAFDHGAASPPQTDEVRSHCRRAEPRWSALLRRRRPAASIAPRLRAPSAARERGLPPCNRPESGGGRRRPRSPTRPREVHRERARRRAPRGGHPRRGGPRVRARASRA